MESSFLSHIKKRIGRVTQYYVSHTHASSACECRPDNRMLWVYRGGMVVLIGVYIGTFSTALASPTTIPTVVPTALSVAHTVPPKPQMQAMVLESMEIKRKRTSTLTIDSNEIVEKLRDENFYYDLPVGDIAVSFVPNAKGVVVFFPQYHKSPGSEIHDPTNDKAVITQEQTNQILQHLVASTPLDTVMVEGELVGSVSPQKQQALSSLVARHEQLKDHIQEVQTQAQKQEIDTILAQQTVQGLTVLEKQLYRAIALAGAPQWLHASGTNIAIVGAEDPQTQDESREIVRNHLYLKDRLAAVQGHSRTEASSASLQKSASIQQILKKLTVTTQAAPNPVQALAQSITSLKQTEQQEGDTNGVVLAEGLQRTLTQLSQDQQMYEMAQVSPQAQAAAPSRSDNPYKTISSVKTLQNLLKENESDLHKTVLYRRNEETAKHMVDVIAKEDSKIAALQYGAAHSEGLIRELNKQGLTVITIVPDIVAQEHPLFENENVVQKTLRF